MRIISRNLVFALAVALAGVSAAAIALDSSSSRFKQIPDRNVFGLKEPEKPQLTNVAPQVPKLLLTGITTVLGDKRALLKEQPPAQQPGGKPADASKDLSLILSEGQREGNVEVLQIDEKLGAVKVNNSGSIMTLTFEKDGSKLPSTQPPAKPGVPGGIPTPGTTLPGTAGPFPNGDTNNGIRPLLPTRGPRGPMNGTASGATPTVPSVPGAVPVVTAPAELLKGLTPEEQSIVLQLQRASQPPALPPPPLPSNPRPILPQ